MGINNHIIEKHGLKIEEYKIIKKLLKRDPNLLELGVFSAMWNEHCSYKTPSSSKLGFILKNYQQKVSGLFKGQERMLV